ncbi:MAG TPA: hypothetical protein VM580_19935 [Labilithrix sp.]|nr:hypothetical protein [Labilithrix sp.]
MATFLTTSKMSPELAARVEASVSGRPAKAKANSARRTRRLVSLARLVLVATTLGGVYNIVNGRRESKRALERTRASLLESVRAESASLPPEHHAAVPRATTWIEKLARNYEGDFIASELVAPGAFKATLSRPIVYARGSLDALTHQEQIPEAAAASTKDAFVLCLLEPPASRTEATLLDKARAAYAGGASGGSNFEARTANVRRLNDAVVGLPFLLPAWSKSVEQAETTADLARLRTEFERAPIARAKQAAAAGLLLVTIDEPGDNKGPTELDGERPHPVRVALVDLDGSRVLLRARHDVDPNWISQARRPTYASGLDSCALALDVHEDVQKAGAATSATKK